MAQATQGLHIVTGPKGIQLASNPTDAADNVRVLHYVGDPVADAATAPALIEAPEGSLIITKDGHFKKTATGVEALASAEYVVGPAGSGAEFDSIQAAIDQAVAEGKEDLTAGATVKVLNGTYTENVAMARGVFLRGASGNSEGCVINGTVTCDITAAPGAGPPSELATITGISYIRVNGGAGAAMVFTGSNVQICLADRCNFNSDLATPLVIDNDAPTGIAVKSTLNCFDCRIGVSPPSPGPVISASQNSNFDAFSCFIDGSPGAPSARKAIEVADTAAGFARDCQIFGQVSIIGAGFYLVQDSLIRMPTGFAASAVICDGDCYLDFEYNCDHTPVIDGTGKVTIGDFQKYAGVGTGVAATLTVVDAKQVFGLNAGDWAGVPETLRETINRIAAEVATLKAGPIA